MQFLLLDFAFKVNDIKEWFSDTLEKKREKTVKPYAQFASVFFVKQAKKTKG